MNIQLIALSELKPYEKNPRNNEKAIDKVAESIKEFGFKVPIVIDKDNIIVAGHTRFYAAKQLKLNKVPCIVADDLTEEQIKAYRLADNKVAEFSEWDFDLLQDELEELSNFDMGLFGFEELEKELSSSWDKDAGVSGSLAEKYIVPPFSVLDSRQGYWKDRKEVWHEIVKSGEGRAENLLGGGLQELAENTGGKLTGTSIFDPVLAEILLTWFCPAGGKVIDPFAGGSVRGLVSTMLGNEYTGVDLSQKQIDANNDNYNEIAEMLDFNGNPLKKPNWICGDSSNIDVLVEGKYDFLLTCPPYADLEVYSDDERDLSNMKYPDFKKAYFNIIKKSVEKLNDNAFMAIVVGDVRDKKGYYYNFVSDTITAFLKAGAKYYNECILINNAATLALRVGKQFSAGRKVGKTHQNVLIFVKGNEKKIELKPYDYDFSMDIEE